MILVISVLYAVRDGEHIFEGVWTWNSLCGDVVGVGVGRRLVEKYLVLVNEALILREDNCFARA